MDLIAVWKQLVWRWPGPSWRRALLGALAVQLTVTLLVTLTVEPLSLGWTHLARSLSRGLIFANCITVAELLIWWGLWTPVLRLPPLIRGVAAVVTFSAGVHAGVLLALALRLALGRLGPADYWADYWVRFQPITVLTLTCGLAALLVVAVSRSLADRARYDTAQARLTSLESRLRPHFLFNTLNSIRVLIADDPAAAEQMVLQLSALLRASLDAADSGTVALERELDLTVSYLEIEKTRFGARFEYAIDVPPPLMRAAVPPFALQTLVENSVKFGGTAIRVQARADAARLWLDVWDSGSGFTGDIAMSTGHGLHTLRSRLTLLWGDRASLEFPASASGTTVRLSMPLRTA
jgi:hypothetical protein